LIHGDLLENYLDSLGYLVKYVRTVNGVMG